MKSNPLLPTWYVPNAVYESGYTGKCLVQFKKPVVDEETQVPMKVTCVWESTIDEKGNIGDGEGGYLPREDIELIFPSDADPRSEAYADV